MPPRKRQKLSSQAPSTPSQADHALSVPASVQTASKPEVDPESIVADPWTDDQEISLLKGIMKWKPVGMHKHFRMLAISDHMKSQGYATDQHTRIPGIWKKLDTLYNLPALDEREDPFATDESEEQDASNELYCPFSLEDDDYGDMMFERRLAPDGSSPPPSLPALSRRGSTVADGDDAGASPAPSRGRRGGRGARRTMGTRSSKLHTKNETGEESNDGGGDADSRQGSADVAKSGRTQATRGKAKRGRPPTRRGRRK